MIFCCLFTKEPKSSLKSRVSLLLRQDTAGPTALGEQMCVGDCSESIQFPPLAPSCFPPEIPEYHRTLPIQPFTASSQDTMSAVANLHRKSVETHSVSLLTTFSLLFFLGGKCPTLKRRDEFMSGTLLWSSFICLSWHLVAAVGFPAKTTPSDHYWLWLRYVLLWRKRTPFWLKGLNEQTGCTVWRCPYNTTPADIHSGTLPVVLGVYILEAQLFASHSFLFDLSVTALSKKLDKNTKSIDMPLITFM